MLSSFNSINLDTPKDKTFDNNDFKFIPNKSNLKAKISSDSTISTTSSRIGSNNGIIHPSPSAILVNGAELQKLILTPESFTLEPVKIEAAPAARKTRFWFLNRIFGRKIQQAPNESKEDFRSRMEKDYNEWLTGPVTRIEDLYNSKQLDSPSAWEKLSKNLKNEQKKKLKKWEKALPKGASRDEFQRVKQQKRSDLNNYLADRVKFLNDKAESTNPDSHQEVQKREDLKVVPLAQQEAGPAARKTRFWSLKRIFGRKVEQAPKESKENFEELYNEWLKQGVNSYHELVNSGRVTTADLYTKCKKLRDKLKTEQEKKLNEWQKVLPSGTSRNEFKKVKEEKRAELNLYFENRDARDKFLNQSGEKAKTASSKSMPQVKSDEVSASRKPANESSEELNARMEADYNKWLKGNFQSIKHLLSSSDWETGHKEWRQFEKKLKTEQEKKLNEWQKVLPSGTSRNEFKKVKKEKRAELDFYFESPDARNQFLNGAHLK